MMQGDANHSIPCCFEDGRCKNKEKNFHRVGSPVLKYGASPWGGRFNSKRLTTEGRCPVPQVRHILLVILSIAKDLHFQYFPHRNQISGWAANFRDT
jgi:hypothetical protein